ncbi:MAG: FAD-dependent oxidoreductase [Pseudomonadota bacterium]
MASIDLTVRGAGIFGLSIAWTATQRGARVRVIDPNGPASGSSGGIVGALAPHVPENWNPKKQFQLESLLMAGHFWTAVEEKGGGNAGYARLGRLQPIKDDHALSLARQRAETAKDLWKAAAVWEVLAADTLSEPSSSKSGYIIRDTLTARIQPRHACEALVRALKSSGVEIVADAAAPGQTVWATGVAGLEDLSQDHHRAVGTGVKGQAALFDLDARDAPQLFVDGLHIVPHHDGTTAVGSTSERVYADPHLTDEKLDALVEEAFDALPALRQAKLIARWAGVRPRARSRAPMLGPWPRHPGHFIANGGFKIGFGIAPKVAEVMTDLILEGRDRIPDGFRLEDSF